MGTGQLNSKGYAQFSGQSAFFAYLGSGQSIATGTWTKATIDTEDFDLGDEYDNSSNYRFTPAQAGKYLVTLNARFAIGVDNIITALALRKNGSKVLESISATRGTDHWTVNITALVDMNGTSDYLEMWVYHNKGSNASIIGPDDRNTWFTAHKVA
jgi:hypothetical protein